MVQNNYAHGAGTGGWSGDEGGKRAGLGELQRGVPSHSIEQIEEIHLMLEHMMTAALRRATDGDMTIHSDLLFDLQALGAH